MFKEQNLSFALTKVFTYDIALSILSPHAFTPEIKEKIAVFVVGANGSGKSTFIANLYDKKITDLSYINADILFLNSKMDNVYQAMSQTMSIVHDYIDRGIGFIYESVFSDVNKLELAQKVVDNGYKLITIYISTASPNINLMRVAKRVSQGGHDVPPEKIILRYARAVRNIQALKDISHSFYQFDNSIDK